MASLRVLTFNCWGVPTASKKAARMDLIAQELSRGEFDLIGLQELWSEKDAAKVMGAAKGGGLNFTHRYRHGAVGTGIVVLSRYPIVEVCFWPYTTTGKAQKPYHADFFAGKGVAYAAISVPNVGVVDFFTTHVHANYAFKYRDESGLRVPLDEYSGVRVSQLMQYAQTVNKFGRGLVIACGDLNARPNQLEIRLFEVMSNFVDVYATMCPGNPGTTMNSADNTFMKHWEPKERIDFIYYHPGPSAWEPQSSALAMTHSSGGFCFSDHFGVTATFRHVGAASGGGGSGSGGEGVTVAPAHSLQPPAGLIQSKTSAKVLRVASAVLQHHGKRAGRRKIAGGMFGLLLLLIGALSGPFGCHAHELVSQRCEYGSVIGVLFGILGMLAIIVYYFNGRVEQRGLLQSRSHVETALDTLAGLD